MAKIITLGEIMLRLSTPGQKRFVQSNQFDVYYGGGEANVAVSLAHFGHDTYFISKLPNNDLGQSAIQALARHNVNTQYIALGGERMGIYFLETGASIRASKVIYDRAHSAISEADYLEFDFEEIFKKADWFHWSGITPALGKKATDLIRHALIEAKKAGLTISVDLNYRKKLWTSDEAQGIMKDLMQYVDVCIGNEEDAALVLGFKPKGMDVTSGHINIEAYQEVFRQMKETFGFKVIASTLRVSYSATKNGWSALLYDGDHFYQSKPYMIEPIIDRVGSGDAFSAGLIHGLLTKKPEDAIEFAVAASALKHTIMGDFNQVTLEDVEILVEGDISGRVKR